MDDKTISTRTPLGQHLGQVAEGKGVSYLVFNKKRIKITALITIGRDSGNDVVIDSKLASRNHAVIQKIRDEYFIKDLDSTNGTFVNGKRIPNQKYVKLTTGDEVMVGNSTLVMGN